MAELFPDKNNSHEGTCVKFSDQKPKTLRLNF